MKYFYDKTFNFKETFRSKDGFYMRSGILDENGKDTNIDPFMRSFPALIDIGIMGSCEHGISGNCISTGVRCYQNGLNTKKSNMSLEMYESFMIECKDKVMQVALGGRGDVNKHEHFEEILKITRSYGIVPNFTTSGYKMTDEEIRIASNYIGAIAVSYYGYNYTKEAVERCVKAGITTNIHFVLSNSSIDNAITLMKSGDLKEWGVNAIIFLLHKPIGLGKVYEVIKYDNPHLNEFFRIMLECETQIGFDSCSVPAILNFSNAIDIRSVDTCEAARFSMYIDAEGTMYPCSFDNQDKKWGIPYKAGDNVSRAWKSTEFDKFRNKFKTACNGCSIKESCLGGCPIVHDIVICDRKEKCEGVEE